MAARKKPVKKQANKPPHLARLFTDEELIETLRASYGLVKFTAKKLGCTPQCIYKRMRSNPAIREVIRDVIKEAKKGFIDIAEHGLVKAVEGGKLPAIFFTLKTLGRCRGYVERREVRMGGDVNAPPLITSNLVTINPDELPLEVRKALLEHIRSKKTPTTQENEHGQNNDKV